MSIDKVGGRRFVLAVLVLLAMVLLRWFDHLDNGSLTAVLIASVCTYIVGDTFNRHSETQASVKNALGAESKPGPVISE